MVSVRTWILFSLIGIWLAGNILADPEIRTIPVSVSNTVSGAFDTIPITFRFGETNGVVERLEGAKFVSVPIKGLVVPHVKVDPVSVPDYLINYESGPLKKYSVPNSFFESAFPVESEFRDHTLYMLNSNSWIVVKYYRAEKKVGFLDVTEELESAFGNFVLNPVLERLRFPDSWEFMPGKVGGEECLFLKGYRGRDLVGLWWYYAELNGAGLINDVFKQCLFDGGMPDNAVAKPCSVEMKNGCVSRELFVLNSANGEVSRGTTDHFYFIETEKSSEPDIKNYPTPPKEASLDRLAGITIPYDLKWGEYKAYFLLVLEQSINSAIGKTDYINFNYECLPSEDVPPYQESQIWCKSVSQEMDAKEAVEYVFGDFTGCGTRFMDGGSNTIDVLSHGAYTQRVSQAYTYILPKHFSRFISTKEDWTKWLNLDGWETIRVESFDPVSSELVVRSDYCDFERICEYLNYLYKRFPNRYKLENRTVNGKPQLLLIDTYRNIPRRYRSWMENGKRRERFEIVNK